MPSNIYVEFLRDYGAIGLFVASYVSHAIPFSYLPTYVLLIAYASYVNDAASLALAVLATALGATLGKLTVYLLGRGFSRVLPKEMREELDAFNKLAERGLALAILIFGIFPLPDDVLYVPLGVTGYDLRKYLALVSVSKIILASVVATYGRFLGHALGVECGNYVGSIISIATTVVLMIVVLRIRWSKVLLVYTEEGLLSAVGEVLNQLKPRRKVRK